MSDIESSAPPSPVSSACPSDNESQGSAPASPRSPTPPPAPAKRKRASSKTATKSGSKTSKATKTTTKASGSTKAKTASTKRAKTSSSKTLSSKKTKKFPDEAPKDPKAYKAPRGRPKTSGKSKVSSKKETKEVKQPRLKKSDIEVPLRYVNTEENWIKTRVFFQELLGKMTYKQFQEWNRRSKRADLHRLKNASKRRVNVDATLAKYKKFLHEADAKMFAELDGVWLMNHGFEGSLSSKAIQSKTAPVGEVDYRYHATLLLFNECRKRKVEPLGIVSGKTNDTTYKTATDKDGNVILNDKGHPKQIVDTFKYAYSIPEGDNRIWVGADSRFRTGFEDHPLSLSRKTEQRDAIPDDERLGVGLPMVTIN